MVNNLIKEKVSYLICTLPRTGSGLLRDLLRNTNIAGIMAEEEPFKPKYIQIDDICRNTAFVDAVCGIPDWFCNNHFRSQHYFVSDYKGKLLVDRIIHLEKIGEELPKLFKKIGLGDRALDWLLSSERQNYREYYSSDLKLKVAKRFRKDIQLFNYYY